jgi:hypothetical protein
MTEPDLFITDQLADSRRILEVLWSVVGCEVPADVQQRLTGVLDLAGEPDTWAEETVRRMSFAIHVLDGIEAAYYHRDRIEEIERGIVRELRAASSGEGMEIRSFTARLPRIDHEWIAYLNAARRTLEFLARAVAECFGRNTDRIKKLAGALTDAEPLDLAREARALCEDLPARFPHLLAEGKGQSLRDRAAHKRPPSPAQLIVFFFGGTVGIELQDIDAGQLERFDTLDLERMTRDEPRLTKVLDAQLDDLVTFCADLLTLAVRAELVRLEGDA